MLEPCPVLVVIAHICAEHGGMVPGCSWLPVTPGVGRDASPKRGHASHTASRFP